MTMNVIKRYKPGLLGIALVAMMLSLSGCFSLSNPFGKRPGSGKMKVVGFANTEAVPLSADDIANILLGVGFTPNEIMNIGRDLRQALMLQGMARIKRDGVWFAQMRVAGGQIQIYLTQRGFFIYDVKTHRFTLAPETTRMQQQGMQQQAPGQPQRQMQLPQQQPQMQMPMQQPQTRQSYPMYPNYPTQVPQSQYQQR